ncbi:MAG: ABC transporter ATP-binding protein/permease [Bacteroidales bacterium]|nr:ABC transporter ATP-binding protein/permease [Bacteroidales bacterium]
MNTLLKLQTFMTGKKALLPAALFLSALSSLAGMAPYVLIWLIVRELFAGNETSFALVNTYAFWAAGLAVGSVLLYFAALSCSHLAAFRAEANVRRYSMKKIVGLPLGFFENHTTGSIRKIIDENASITHTFLAHQMPDLAGSIIMPLSALVLILGFDWRLGLACMIPIVVALFNIRIMMGKKGKEYMWKYMNSLEDMNTEAVEYVRGIPVVKVFQQTVFSFKNFYKSIMKYREMVINYTKVCKIPMSVYMVIINSFAFFLIPAAILLVGSSGNYSGVLLNLFFFVLITPVFSQSIMRSMYLSQAVEQAGQAVERIEELTNVKPLIESDISKPVKGYDLSYDDVTFCYPGTNIRAVDHVSFSIPQGATIALVGPSGGGKTTLARLIPRFWDVDGGTVSIGGTDVRDISHGDLMKNISFVFQNTHLFKTSLLENIRYGKPSACDEEINNAVDLAQCREIIDKLPDGLNTKIGTDGTYLSGGEQQRIALARAILKDAPIVVLDEATAFTDPENEYLIRSAIEKLTRGKTVLMIAHRLTSVINANKILVVKNGTIAEQGTHEELIKNKGIYTNMWNEYQQSVKWTIGKEVGRA